MSRIIVRADGEMMFRGQPPQIGTAERFPTSMYKHLLFPFVRPCEA
jgi:hypothetical protein